LALQITLTLPNSLSFIASNQKSFLSFPYTGFFFFATGFSHNPNSQLFFLPFFHHFYFIYNPHAHTHKKRHKPFFFFFFFFTMSEEYYNSKKTDDICDDVCGQVLFFFPISVLFFVFNLFFTVLKFVLLLFFVIVFMSFCVVGFCCQCKTGTWVFFWVCEKFNSFSKFVFLIVFLFQIWIDFFSGSVKSLSLYLCVLMFGYFSIFVLNLEMIDGFIILWLIGHYIFFFLSFLFSEGF